MRSIGLADRKVWQWIAAHTMILRIFALACFLGPVLAAADPLDIYGELTGKTVLAPSTLPLLSAIPSELPSEKTKAIAFLESEFSKQGITIIDDGPSFVRLVPQGKGWSVVLSNAPLRGAQLRLSAGQQVSPGTINFPPAELSQVLDIYAELKNRTILRRAVLPSPLVRLKNQCPLTREEIIYAFETVLALNGIGTMDDGKSFVQITPIALRSQTSAHAPTPDPGAELFDPKRLPSMGVSNSPRAQTKLERDLERWQKAFFEFIRLNGSHTSPAQRLLELYADLADKKAQASTNYSNIPIWFHMTTPVAKSELLYAIETTFALNNLAITRVNNETIGLGPGAGPRKDVGSRRENREPNP
jgi:hypothetical protein